MTDKAYSCDRLVQEAHAFLGVPSHVAAGALKGTSGEITVEEAKQIIDAWLSRPVR